MKTLRLALLSLLGISTLLNSCTKEKSFEVPGGGNIIAEWEFKENKDYKGSIDTAYIEDFGTTIKTLSIEGTSSDGKETLIIQVVGINPTTAATYKTPQVLFQYLGQSSALYISDITAIGDFTVVITKIDSVSVTGTFTGKVKDSINANKTIVEGKFSARLHNPSNPPVANGQLTFWAKASCTAGGNITVKLNNNQTGAITTFTANEPTCGATGTASFTLPAGLYNWTAKCGTSDSTSGVVTVQANQCVKLEVVFAPPMDCAISDFAFYDFTTNLAFGTIRSNYTGRVVNNIQFIDSVNGVVEKSWNITYPAGRVQLDANQYFVVDANNRITEYHGLEDPLDETSEMIITKYSYDANGYMSGYNIAYADTPSVIVWRGVLQWNNGNLIKLTEDSPAFPTTSEKYETTYEYHAMLVKNFIYTIPLPEITLFQTTFNAGKKSQNALKTETFKKIDPVTGNVSGTLITNYDNYAIDPSPNQYVKSFRQIDPSSPADALKIVLSYKCF